ncbi:zinc finger CCCH domain-containing protein 3 [Actinidia eriantha]|uniref:zinc finger CCCH domain-containing protein 3 n=1 Tax=Actinidia eriantha TaxID=165200 RepID=UPI00258D52EC|nr:zinc finger CCCH domain-containing protein 3 [Actinidia eriantha]XP_057469937.1 zinc finger CCCH domain-containing protein 3 [Actinidia eriantha]
MPLLKYYCDYCDKQFQDTPSARKRHLQGVQHQRAKALWFNSFPDANHQIHAESFGKGICNRFVRTGSCQYGDSCKYFHPKQNFQGLNPQGIPGNIQSPSIPENQLAGGQPFPGVVVRDSMGISLGNLPPSLKPPSEGGYPPLPFIDWG